MQPMFYYILLLVARSSLQKFDNNCDVIFMFKMLQNIDFHGVLYEGRFPLGGIFRAEQHFLLFKDQLAESGGQKTK